MSDPHDQLVDRLLAEALGGEAPPDVAERVLQRVAEEKASPSAAKPLEFASDQRRSWLRPLAIAASVAGVLAVGRLLTLTAPEGVRPIAKKQDKFAAAPLATPPATPKRGEESGVLAESSRGRAQEPTSGPGDRDRVVVDLFEENGRQLAERSATTASDDPATLEPEALAKPAMPGRNAVVRNTATPATPAEAGASIDRASSMDLLSVPAAQSGPIGMAGGVAGGQGGGGVLSFSAQAPALQRVRSGAVLGVPVIVLGDGLRREERGVEGTGPGLAGDQYTRIQENPFVRTIGGDAVSTFSIDVDTASYANVRQMILQAGALPPPDAVRIEEMVNYFAYNYPSPVGDGGDKDAPPFSASLDVAPCPWNSTHRIVRVGLKGREVALDKRPLSNLVFLVDVSGSMSEPNKLPLVVEGLEAMVRELGENDRVAVVVYASSEGLVLDSTPGDRKDEILAALGRLAAGGSTAGGAGLRLAYQVAEDHKIAGGVNRVILCTDGDFNVGATSTAELERLVERKAKETGVFLSVLGFGRGNLNDAMMEGISNRGNGFYAYIDTEREARRVLVEQLSGTLVTIAKDVKAQVEFNPARVAAYRLLGYENRMLRTEDFKDDRKDAGDIGAGHTVTALYEIVPAGGVIDAPAADPLKYQPQAPAEQRSEASAPRVAGSDELLTLKLRWKAPDADASTQRDYTLRDEERSLEDASADFRFAASVAELGLLLRRSEHKGEASYDRVISLAEGAIGADEDGRRKEFVKIARRARAIAGE